MIKPIALTHIFANYTLIMCFMMCVRKQIA